MQSRFKTIILALCALLGLQSYAQTSSSDYSVTPLSDTHAFVRISADKRFVLLPVEEKEELAVVKVIVDNQLKNQFNIRLAVSHIDYYVPVLIDQYRGKQVLLDVKVNTNRRSSGLIKDFAAWNELQLTDSFDAANREYYRPTYHHTPIWGWMNDPNGMFYKDGVWHLYYQYNPYGSQWENMTWGHSTSKDLIHWTHEGTPLRPDALGTIFSGSAVVDKNNTAGFGKNAVIAMYTSAGESQTQSIAYSLDDGKTFTKYVNNPVLTANITDFRDPHIFWNEDIKAWNMILAAGQQMNIYTSNDLKTWHYESSFGSEYGNHGGVWECPDLFKLRVAGTSTDKWILLCNINPGGPFGGSATQYFIGSFDGYRFVCESEPTVTKWMDYGKDHYAIVSFDNAPDNRRVAIAWMSNWQYANDVPTKQFRSANTLPRDLGLFQYGSETYVSAVPSKEVLSLRKQKVSRLQATAEVVVDVKSQSKPLLITLANDKGESVDLAYDPKALTFTMDRTKSGVDNFSDHFKGKTIAPTYGTISQLRIFIDKSSIEIFDTEGKMTMTNLVFPTKPYDKLTIKGSAKTTIYALND